MVEKPYLIIVDKLSQPVCNKIKKVTDCIKKLFFKIKLIEINLKVIFMKLKNGIVTNSIDGESFAIATGEATKEFNGLIKNNPTAAFIFELLKTEQTPDSIVKAMTDKYDVDEATARADVNELLNLLKSKNIIEE